MSGDELVLLLFVRFKWLSEEENSSVLELWFAYKFVKQSEIYFIFSFWIALSLLFFSNSLWWSLDLPSFFLLRSLLLLYWSSPFFEIPYSSVTKFLRVCSKPRFISDKIWLLNFLIYIKTISLEFSANNPDCLIIFINII